MNGVVFDIQHYAIYDGPGIRTSIYLKGCPLRCSWCHNPESQLRAPQMSYNEERCNNCGLCIPNCHNNALKFNGKIVIREQSLCLACNECGRICDRGAMELIGKSMSVAEIVAAVLSDQVFYDHSNGGVTLTGGEPTAQKDFLRELLPEFRKHGIHTALETCGYFPIDFIEFLVTHTDLFLFDIKHLDPVKHKQATGVDNEIILRNFMEILRRVGNQRMIVRIPLIPGFNDDLESLSGIQNFLRKNSFEGEVHLMPYHDLGIGKYKRIGRRPTIFPVFVQENLEAFKEYGILYGR